MLEFQGVRHGVGECFCFFYRVAGGQTDADGGIRLLIRKSKSGHGPADVAGPCRAGRSGGDAKSFFGEIIEQRLAPYAEHRQADHMIDAPGGRIHPKCL